MLKQFVSGKFSFFINRKPRFDMNSLSEKKTIKLSLWLTEIFIISGP